MILTNLGLGVTHIQVLEEPGRLPSAEEAAFRSLPESSMSGQRYELAEKLLSSYCPEQLLAFMFGHDRGSAACQLLYPPHTEATMEVTREAAIGSAEVSADPSTIR